MEIMRTQRPLLLVVCHLQVRLWFVKSYSDAAIAIGSALTLRVDRFDLGKTLGDVHIPTVLIPGDMPIKVTVHTNGDQDSEGREPSRDVCDDLFQRQCHAPSVDLKDFFYLEAFCHVRDDTLSLQWSAVCWSTTFLVSCP